jgi:hypothetical protein
MTTAEMKEKTGDDEGPAPTEEAVMASLTTDGEEEVAVGPLKGLKGEARCWRSHCCRIHVNDEWSLPGRFCACVRWCMCRFACVRWYLCYGS